MFHCLQNPTLLHSILTTKGPTARTKPSLKSFVPLRVKSVILLLRNISLFPISRIRCCVSLRDLKDMSCLPKHPLCLRAFSFPTPIPSLVPSLFDHSLHLVLKGFILRQEKKKKRKKKKNENKTQAILNWALSYFAFGTYIILGTSHSSRNVLPSCYGNVPQLCRQGSRFSSTGTLRHTSAQKIQIESKDLGSKSLDKRLYRGRNCYCCDCIRLRFGIKSKQIPILQ